jgi:hypothetical protein
VLVLAAAGVYAMVGGFAPGGGVPSVESALPDVSDSDLSAAAYLKVTDTASLSHSISALSGFVSLIEGDLGYGEERGALVPFLELVQDIADTADELSLVITSSDAREFYLSFYASPDKFDSFVSGFGDDLATVALWETDRAKSGDAWVIRPASAGEDDLEAFYMTRRGVGDRSFVMMSLGEPGIDRMTRALDDPSARYKPSRRTEGGSVALAEFKEPLELEGRRMSVSEMGWSRSKSRISVDIYSDLYSGAAANITSPDAMGSRPPILGDGELSFFYSAYLPFYFDLLFPGEEDPVSAFFEKAGGIAIPREIASYVEDILGQARVSAVVTIKDEAPGTAYVVIESGAQSSMDGVFSLAGLFLGPNKIKLAGWDSAYSTKIDANISSILAKRGNFIMVGLGNADDYAKELAMSDSKDFDVIASPSSVSSMMFVPMLVKGDLADIFTESLEEGLVEALGGNAAVMELLKSFIGDVESLRTRQMPSGHSYIDIVLRESRQAAD